MEWMPKDRLSSLRPGSIVGGANKPIDIRMNNTYPGAEATRIYIAAGQAVSVQVSVGTEIQCVHGHIWLTQQSDSRDYCLAAGLSFCVDKTGQAVLTSLNGTSVVLVRRADSRMMRHIVPGTIRLHSMEQLTGAAKQARSDYLADVVSALMRRLAVLLRRLRRTFRTPGEATRNP
jgi:Protein of unknown function (DUF2917)